MARSLAWSCAPFAATTSCAATACSKAHRSSALDMLTDEMVSILVCAPSSRCDNRWFSTEISREWAATRARSSSASRAAVGDAPGAAAASSFAASSEVAWRRLSMSTSFSSLAWCIATAASTSLPNHSFGRAPNTVAHSLWACRESASRACCAAVTW
eukprot:scaffold2297_cov102-Isochrysis_galbana.AAC.15